MPTLWEKSTRPLDAIERFTVGHDRELDLYLAPYDVLGSIAHTTMLGAVGLLPAADLDVLLPELRAIYHDAVEGRFVIEEGVEDVHSQVELLLTRRLGEAGKKIHSGRSRNDQVLVDLKLFTRDALRRTADEEGHIDYVINTAGVLNREPLNTMDYDTIRAAVDTNYMGTVHVALEAYPYLKETKGKLVFFTSSSYTRGRAFYSIYSSTKAAIVNFVQAVAQEWEPAGITVNCINPERTKTPMRVKNFGVEPDDSLLASRTVAEATVGSLLSDYTGQVIDVKRKRS